MKERLPHIGENVEGPTWGTAAFLVESMLLLVFLAVAMAMFLQLFGLALARAGEGEDLSRAAAVASSAAERFAADPSQSEGSYEDDGMIVRCEVNEEAEDSGVLYTAVIRVYDAEASEPCYAISTTRYVSGVTR